MSIATQIEALQTDKTNIANAITAKGGTVGSGDGFDDFASDIATITTPVLQEKTTTSSAVAQEITPDSGYNGLSKVTINRIPASTYDASANISGEAVLETGSSKNYKWQSRVTIPAGYYEQNTYTKDFNDIFPEPGTEGDSANLQYGYQLYDHTGTLLTGSMPEVDIPAPTMTFNSTTKKVNATGSWTKGHTNNNSYSNDYTVTLDNAKAVTGIGDYGAITATKGTASGGSMTITPQIATGTAGYYDMPAETGTAITVSASELVSGTLSITDNGEQTVTNYEKVNVAVPIGYDIVQTISGDESSVAITEHSQSHSWVVEEKTLTLGSAAPSSVTPSTGYDGIASVAVALDSSVIKAANIASGVQMLGITGTHSGGSASYTDNASGGMTCEITI